MPPSPSYAAPVPAQTNTGPSTKDLEKRIQALESAQLQTPAMSSPLPPPPPPGGDKGYQSFQSPQYWR